MTRFGGKVDELSVDLGSTRDALHLHADDLTTVRSRMALAREIAADAGLATTETTIAEPGPPPIAPAALPTDRAPTPAEVSAYDAGNRAVTLHAAQVSAYDEAGRVVTEARGIETSSQGVLHRFRIGQAQKAPFTVADVATGLAATSIRRTSEFRARAQQYADRAAHRAGLARTGGLWSFVKNTVAKEYNLYRHTRTLERATPTAWSRGLDRLSPHNKDWLIRGLSRTNPVLKRVPVIGSALTLAGIGWDIGQGKDPVQSAVSGVSSLAAGAAVGAAIGGPVGVVVGAVVGAGVGFVVDEWGDEIGGAAQDFGQGVVGAGADLVDGTVGTAKKIGDWLGF